MPDTDELTPDELTAEADADDAEVIEELWALDEVSPADDAAALSLLIEAADSQLEQGHYRAAVLSLTHAVSIAPNDASLLVKLGGAHTLTQNYPAAIESFTQAIRIEPQNPRPLALRAWAFQLNGETHRAEADRARARHLRKTAQK